MKILFMYENDAGTCRAVMEFAWLSYELVQNLRAFVDLH